MAEDHINKFDPLYVQVSKQIRSEIRDGKLIRGERLPNEISMAEKYEVSRGTIRKSLAVLQEEGYIETVHGKGSFISDDRVSSPIAQHFISFAEDMEHQGLTFTTDVLTKELVAANDSNQFYLKVPEETKLLYLERLRTVNGKPAIFLRNWIVLDQCPGIEKHDFENVGLFEAMEETMGEKIQHGVRKFSALNADKEIQEQLDLKKDAVLLINQTSFNNDNIPIEYSEIYLRTDEYQVTSSLPREKF